VSPSTAQRCAALISENKQGGPPRLGSVPAYRNNICRKITQDGWLESRAIWRIGGRARCRKYASCLDRVLKTGGAVTSCQVAADEFAGEFGVPYSGAAAVSDSRIARCNARSDAGGVDDPGRCACCGTAVAGQDASLQVSIADATYASDHFDRRICWSPA